MALYRYRYQEQEQEEIRSEFTNTRGTSLIRTL